MEVLQRYTRVRLDEMKPARRWFGSPSIAITFDDGYADNYRAAARNPETIRYSRDVLYRDRLHRRNPRILVGRTGTRRRRFLFLSLRRTPADAATMCAAAFLDGMLEATGESSTRPIRKPAHDCR